MFKLVRVVLVGVLIARIGWGEPQDVLIRPGAAKFSVTPEVQLTIPPQGATRSGWEPLDRFMDQIGATLIEPTYPSALPPLPGGPDLRLHFNLYFPASLPVLQVVKDLGEVEGVDIAEPWYIYRVLFRPNDPYYLQGNQYHLRLLHMEEAWDIHRGDPRVIVGGVDTGVDYQHPDIAGNMWINPGEDLNGNGVIDQNERNGRDDEGNGYVDDFYGWDFIQRDNTPMDQDGHGTHTAGIMSAVTNNNLGVASVAFSCRIMAVRAGSGNTITYGYEGIQYAARNGAKVINCSWGGYQGSALARQVVEDAHRRGALVVAAAGNENVSNILYPAGYPTVVSVAATDQNDRKANFSNYGNWVKISAPGVQVLAPIPGSRYAYLSGTSMASPVAAGAAALLRAAYPNLTPAETAELLYEGADDIYEINFNYRGQLGAGRVNAYRSLQLGNRPLLAIDTLVIVSDPTQNERLDPGDTVGIAITISNSPNGVATEDIRVQVFVSDPDVAFPPDAVPIPNLDPGDAYTNSDEPFLIAVSPNAIPHTTWLTVLVDAQPGNVHLERTFELLIGHPDVLIVDDDDGAEAERAYMTALEDIGLGWARWDVVTRYAPDPFTLTDYAMVIWVTGDANPPLDDLDRFQLESALSEGANILLIGKRIGDYEENRELLYNYFGALHEEDSVAAVLATGLSGERPLGEDVQIVMAGGGGSDPRISPSTMRVARQSDSLLVYKRASGEITGLAGVYRIDPIRGSKVAYIGFSLEWTSNAGGRRNRAIQRLYEWFMREEQSTSQPVSLPKSYLLYPPYPNPFNNQTQIRFLLPHPAWVGLDVVDVRGRLVERLVEGELKEGLHSRVWSGGSLPSGIYLIRLNGDRLPPLHQKMVIVR